MNQGPLHEAFAPCNTVTGHEVARVQPFGIACLPYSPLLVTRSVSDTSRAEMADLLNTTSVVLKHILETKSLPDVDLIKVLISQVCRAGRWGHRPVQRAQLRGLPLA